jgi:hypothetical protein
VNLGVAQTAPKAQELSGVLKHMESEAKHKSETITSLYTKK